MKSENKKSRQNIFLFTFLSLIFTAMLFVTLPYFMRGYYVRSETIETSNQFLPIEEIVEEEIITLPSYVDTPESVKGIYMTSWVASNKPFREDLVKIIDDTEINSVVIDIKDYSGKIVYEVSDPELKKHFSEEIRVKDLKDFIEYLHSKNIYVIGRLAVFQDSHFVKIRPDLAVKTKDGLNIWKDRKGISWIDPGSKEYWDYIILIAKESRKIGFDEINFDYIRFPSDGNMKDISYPISSTTERTVVMREFFEYIKNNLSDSGLKISADLFGMVTNTRDDMGIGQVLEDALPYFDYIMPMVYPSHYPPNFQGYSDPEKHPYEIIKFSMSEAVARREFLSSTTGQTLGELRPWLQDFGLKNKYGPEEVRKQIQATYDVGLDSWILWSPSNKYNKGALNQE